MKRCTLCGGKVAGNGICTECGLNNEKNDKKYRLNVHNENSRMFRHSDCEDNLNQENRRKQQEWKRMLEIEDPRIEQNQVFKKSNLKTSEHREDIFDVKKEKTSASRRKEIRKRHQTGTVKKKKGILARLIRWIVILGILAEAASSLVPDLMDEFRYLMEDGFSQNSWSAVVAEPEEGYPEQRPAEKIEEKIIDLELAEENAGEPAAGMAAEDGYFELQLHPGFYYVGYDIPAGDYQLECVTESAWVNWWNPQDSSSEYACLYSPERQQTYEKLMGRECEYQEYSEVLTMKEGSILFVEESEGILKLSGAAEELSVIKTRDPQSGLPVVPLSETEEALYACSDIPAGVYDVVLKDGKGNAEVEYEWGGRTYYFYLNETNSRVLRLGMDEGISIRFSYGWDDAQVLLEPSY